MEHEDDSSTPTCTDRVKWAVEVRENAKELAAITQEIGPDAIRGRVRLSVTIDNACDTIAVW
jgi:hypothetical protein